MVFFMFFIVVWILLVIIVWCVHVAHLLSYSLSRTHQAATLVRATLVISLVNSYFTLLSQVVNFISAPRETVAVTSSSGQILHQLLQLQ